MRPYVILHNAVSLDGYVTGFDVDLGLYYELASTWEEDATLAGCDTLLTGLAAERIEPDREEEPEGSSGAAETAPEGTLPLLAVPDSRGRLRSWRYLIEQPFWRAGVALCSTATPQEHLEYLERRHIDRIVAGEDHVDLGRALEQLHSRYGVDKIRVDSGGTLNGLLLRAGLVDEVSLLVHPVLVGGPGRIPFFSPAERVSRKDRISMELTHEEKRGGGLVWLRYRLT
jgi:2,5-diamino-6-(ribosylamino)-4(3H)-pyrimidinone 5'-phosphate reductase